MGTATELPLVECRACGEGLRGCWEFAPDDLYCGLCGRRVFLLAFREDVPRPDSPDEPEVWVYASEGEDLLVHAWGLHGVPGTGCPQVAVSPDFGDRTGTARFSSPEFGAVGFAVEFAGRQKGPPATLADPAPCPPKAWRVPGPAAVRLKLVPDGAPIPFDRIPPGGVPGRIVLGGPHGAVRPARLLRLVPDPLEFSPPPSDESPPELIGYQDERNVASVQLGVTARGRVVAREIHGDARDLRGIRPTTVRGVSFPCEFAPGMQARMSIRFDADPNPEPRQPLTINWELAGYPRPVAYSCLVTLRPRPLLAVRPYGDLPEEVALGGRPVEVVLILDPLLREGNTLPVIQHPPELALDPPEDEWLRAEAFPVTPFPLSGPYPVRLTLDLSRLDRAATHGRMLTATVGFADQAGTIWPCTLRFRAVRLKSYDGVLAIDWGTTNTCAAKSDGAEAPPQPLALPPPELRDDPPDYEQFPSVLYVEDVSDPARPVFHLGPMARDLADLRGRPECLLHSLKRRFLAGGEVYVRDEVGKEHAYPVEELTRLVLLRLVEMAEHELGREVRHLGFTFPTKWPAAARRRFAKVLRQVAADLTAARPRGPTGVRLTPPDIDEANAVALNVLHAMQLRGKLVSGRPFTLVAYDFGGGTIDTSVLRVSLDETADPQLTTRYLGIGGTSDFGGDEVTRAAVMLLRDRINLVLEDARLDGVRYELPLRRDGDPPGRTTAATGQSADLNRDRDGLRNWERVRRMAEEIKRRLCRPPADEADDPVRDAIGRRLEQLVCYPVGDGPPRSLSQLIEAAFPAERAPFFEALRFGLSEVCNYPLGSSSVADRVRDTFLEIKSQLVAAGTTSADVIVLAGGGGRLPLVAEMVREFLGPPPGGVSWDDPDRLVYDPDFAKQRVAHGKATYLALARHSDALTRGLARSVDVLHRPIVVTLSGVLGVRQETVVNVGELVNDPGRQHRFKLTPRHLKMDEDGRRQLWLSVLTWSAGKPVAGRIGYFDLDTPASAASPLPQFAAAVEAVAELTLARSAVPAAPEADPPIRLSLTVRWPDGHAYGPFEFTPDVLPGELDERLQGECG